MSCEHCNGPGEDQKCCWAKAMKIEKFKRQTLHKFIYEVIFDLTISVCSVISDILSLVLYLINGRWLFVFLTAVPVLLPTTVFTNIYLSDESRGYCKMPNDRLRRRQIAKSMSSAGIKIEGPQEDENSSSKSFFASCFSQFTCGLKCTNARNCCGGLANIFNKDSNIRRKGASAIRKSLSRSTKYFLGTFVLRFIAWAWYFKALIHGIKAYRSPKKFMKIESPDNHWSHDLLVKLDFLQAALENAPQCAVQLYALITQPDEQRTLGMFTLVFSFVDFVRVAMAVLWDIHKGPVIAPKGCYATRGWKLSNFCSWTLVYAARSCSLALAFATSKGWTISIVVIGLSIHIVLFAGLFSKNNKYGVATEKVAVSTFISLFFLPELVATDMELLVQFYYSMILLQNIFFIIPWNGLDYDYCIQSPPIIVINSTKSDGGEYITRDGEFGSYNTFENDFEKGNFQQEQGGCLIDPVIIVLMVPACTIVGMVLRLAAAQAMANFQKTVPTTQYSMKMEERIAGIYSKKWTSMNITELSSAFLRMLKKEVAQSEPEGKKKNVPSIANELKPEFITSQNFIRNSFNLILLGQPGNDEQRKASLQDNGEKLHREASIDKNWSFPTRGLTHRSMSLCQQETPFGSFKVDKESYSRTMKPSWKNNFEEKDNLQTTLTVGNLSEEHDVLMDINDDKDQNDISKDASVPQSYFKPCLQINRESTSSSSSEENNMFTTLGVDIQAIQIEFPDGKNHTLEMGWI